MPEPSSANAFVGRQSELAVLQRALEAAEQGAPAVVLIGGDAGIGKSTLVAEGARRAGADLVVGRCVPMAGETIPLAPLAELVRNVRRSGPALLSSPSLAALQRWVGPETTASSRGMAAGDVFEHVLALLASLAVDAVTAVAFEDLHWADPLTWDLFDFVARNLVDERVVLIGTYRTDEISSSPERRRRLGELARLPLVHRLHLQGLSRAEVAAKIQALLQGTPPFDLVEDVYRRGQGNPFFTRELVAAHQAGQALPELLSDLIAADLAALGATTHRALAVIAALGHDTPHDLLAGIVDVGDDQLETAVREAIDAHVLVLDGASSTYRFRHALISEVVYDGLLPPQRQRLHRRIADTLQGRDDRRRARGDRITEIAFHLDRAGDHAAAFVALLAAADATEAVAPRVALHQLERAFELWDSGCAIPGDARRGDRLWQAAELASGTAGNERAAALGREAIGYGPPARGPAWGHERLGRYLWSSGHLEESAAEYATAAALVPATAGPESAPVFAGLGQAELMLARYDAAAAHAERVVALLPGPDADPLAWSMGRRVLGIVASHRGDTSRGVELCREAVAVAPSAVARALALLYLGVSLHNAGQYQAAVSEMLDAAADAHRTGLAVSFGGYLDALVAEGLVRLGRWSEADAVLRHSEGAGALPVGRIRLARSGALLAARRGDRETAVALLAQAEDQPVDPFHRSFLDAAAAEVDVSFGRWSQAAAITGRALAERPGRIPLWQARFAMFHVIAHVELILDARAHRQPVDEDDALGRVRVALAQAHLALPGHELGIEQADSDAHLAHAAATLTRLGAPEPDAWAEAAQRWEHLGDPFWVANARLHEAGAAAACGAASRAAGALQHAHQLALALGASTLLADIEATSRRTRLGLAAPAPAVLDEAATIGLGLTPREAEVLGLVAAGQTNRQIGERLYVSEKTASVHVSNILRKLGVRTRVDAAAVAQRVGIA